MANRFQNIKLVPGTANFEGEEFHKGLGHQRVRVIKDGAETVQEFDSKDSYVRFSAGFPLFLIREAWGLGCSFEREADGYGPGRGTHGDWSGIRDSSPEAVERMLEKALNFIFPPRQL